MYKSFSDDNYYETLGSRLRQLRKARGLTQEDIARQMGITRSTVCTYENDVRQPPYDMLIRLAVFYRVSTDYLLGCQPHNENTIDLGRLCSRDAFIVRGIISLMEEAP